MQDRRRGPIPGRARRLLAAAALLAAPAALLAAPAAAQQQVGGYYAELAAVDMVSSAGRRLTALGDILQQDRANYHRFGIRQPADEGDPLFADRRNRAAIPELYRSGPGEPLIERILREGTPLTVFVVLCGGPGVVRYLVVNFADGDGYAGC